MNTTFNTNTNIAPLLDVSTYDGGPFSYEALWHGDEEAEREEGRLVCDDYDTKAMGERIVHEANLVFDADKPLKDYGVVSIKATELGSPREYNFMTDWLELTVEVDDTFFDKALAAIEDPQNRKAIVDHCKEHWVSRDGFTSAMLNRVSDLSLNYWRHKEYGEHISTDKEIEEAVMADLREAIEHLRNGDGYDDFREFGAVLALLWRFEYPDDFSDSRDTQMWVTEQMVDHLRGNSSISEFCTVLEPHEIKERFGAHMCPFDEFRRDAKADKEKYLAADFKDPEHARAVAEKFYAEFEKYLDGNVDDELSVISNSIGRGDEYVCKKLDEFKSEWEAHLQADITRMWREAYDSLRETIKR